MKIAYNPNQFEFEDGKVAARFIGIKLFDNPNALGRNGEPIGPGLLWEFLVLTGPDMGKRIGKITTTYPTKANACGRLIMAMTDKPLDPEAGFDDTPFRGGYFTLNVIDGKLSDAMGPRFVISGKAEEEAVVNAFKSAGLDITSHQPAESGPAPTF